MLPHCCYSSCSLILNDSWLAIEQHKLANIDSSWSAALSAARAAGALDVVHKLDAMIGVVPKQQQHWQQQQQQQQQHFAAVGLAAAGLLAETEFKPDLALKQVSRKWQLKPDMH
jgi:hypothetical protein